MLRWVREWLSTSPYSDVVTLDCTSHQVVQHLLHLAKKVRLFFFASSSHITQYRRLDYFFFFLSGEREQTEYAPFVYLGMSRNKTWPVSFKTRRKRVHALFLTRSGLVLM